MKFIIKSDIDIDNMAKAVLARFVMNEKSLLVKITNNVRNKSDEQTNLYHMWAGEIGNELGYSKEEVKYIYQEKFMLDIYVENDIRNFKEVARNMKMVQGKVSHAEYQALRKTIIESMTHTVLNVKLMSEYLTSIKYHAQGDLNIRLTEPDKDDLLKWVDRQGER